MLSLRHTGNCLAVLVAAVIPMAIPEHAVGEDSRQVAPPERTALPGQEPANGRFALAIHGGALGDPSKQTPAQRAVAEKTLTQALEIGERVLGQGGSSLDAVEQVIRFLEDDPTFNAGRGAVLNAAGGHELDASIMEGSGKRCGAVAGVRTVKNPITLARRVMEQTRHVLLAGEGAEAFAREMQVEQVENSWFTTPERRAELERAQAKQKDDQQHQGTVGCVALDVHGNLAAGTSTGGLTNKLFGRVGDSPIIGAGTYADNATCAVSCTGTGEEFIRHAVAYDVSAQMAYQKRTVEEAVRDIVTRRLAPGIGGLIAIDRSGQITMQFNTGGMARAARQLDGRREIQVGQ